MQTGCGGRLSGTEGTFQSPGYPHGVPQRWCEWVITSPPNTRITLEFEDMDLKYFQSYNNRTYCWMGQSVKASRYYIGILNIDSGLS